MNCKRFPSLVLLIFNYGGHKLETMAGLLIRMKWCKLMYSLDLIKYFMEKIKPTSFAFSFIKGAGSFIIVLQD